MIKKILIMFLAISVCRHSIASEDEGSPNLLKWQKKKQQVSEQEKSSKGEEKKSIRLKKVIKRYPNVAILFVDTQKGNKESSGAKTAKIFLEASAENLYKDAGLVFIIADKGQKSADELNEEFDIKLNTFPVIVLFQNGEPVKKGKNVAQLVNPSSKQAIISFINDRLEDDLQEEVTRVKKYAKEADEDEEVDEKTVVNNYYYYNYEDNSYQMYNPGLIWPYFWPWGWSWGLGMFWGGGWWGWGHYHYHGRGRGGYHRNHGGHRGGSGHHRSASHSGGRRSGGSRSGGRRASSASSSRSAGRRVHSGGGGFRGGRGGGFRGGGRGGRR